MWGPLWWFGQEQGWDGRGTLAPSRSTCVGGGHMAVTTAWVWTAGAHEGACGERRRGQNRATRPFRKPSVGTDGSHDRQDLVLLVRPAWLAWQDKDTCSEGLPCCARPWGCPTPTRSRTRTSLSRSVLDSCICFSIWDLCSIINVFSYVNAEMSFST